MDQEREDYDDRLGAPRPRFWTRERVLEAMLLVLVLSCGVPVLAFIWPALPSR